MDAENLASPPGFGALIVQPVVNFYMNYAIPVPQRYKRFLKNRWGVDVLNDLNKLKVKNIRQIEEKAYNQNIDIQQLYIGLKKAYDSVNRKTLTAIMYEFGIPHKLVRLIHMTLSETEYVVKIQGKFSRKFSAQKGLKQGDGLYTMLFNMCLEKTMRNIQMNPGGTILNRTLLLLAYADDLALIGRYNESIDKVMTQIQEPLEELGLQINTEKTKYIITSRGKNTGTMTIKPGGKMIERVDKFQCLYCILTDDNRVEEDIKTCIAVGNRCLGGLYKIIKSCSISRATKIKIHKVVQI
jgi:predicted transcriptional regulator